MHEKSTLKSTPSRMIEKNVESSREKSKRSLRVCWNTGGAARVHKKLKLHYLKLIWFPGFTSFICLQIHTCLSLSSFLRREGVDWLELNSLGLFFFLLPRTVNIQEERKFENSCSSPEGRTRIPPSPAPRTGDDLEGVNEIIKINIWGKSTATAESKREKFRRGWSSAVGRAVLGWEGQCWKKLTCFPLELTNFFLLEVFLN